MAARGLIILVIPIIFSFVFGGTVLGLALQGPKTTEQSQNNAIKILELQNQYSTGQKVNVQIQTNGAEFDCGNLYVTVYDVSGGEKKAVKQGAFFDQCYGESGVLPVNDKFSEKFDAGQYLLEAQLFDKKGDKFVSASQKFSIQ